MFEVRQIRIRIIAAACSVAALAGCATPPPPPPPPPPPVQAVIPSRPTPPGGAVSIMAIPAVGVDGLRRTVNYDLSAAQTVWNLRSALNVAALNCQDSAYVGLVPAYSTLLSNNKRELGATIKTVSKEFKDRYGSEGREAQDNYMTQVYNYFALPPAQESFCRTASQIANESLSVAPGDLESFAARSLKSLEGVFEDFYRSYEQYRVNVAMWDARYGLAEPVNPGSYTGPAIYTQVDQGFGPEQTGEPNFVSEPVVEGGTADTAPRPNFGTEPMTFDEPGFESSDSESAPGAVAEVSGFVSNPVVEPTGVEGR